MSLPILYHYFPKPLPYLQGLALQEQIHQSQFTHLQASSSSHRDVLLLLQHRPVYTAGRRQTDESVKDDRSRLSKLGADFVTSTRGGELTYHGPGQIVGYPLLDLSRWSPILGTRDYVCRIQKTIERHLLEAHGIYHIPSEHTGVFLDATTKIGSIGIQIRHRLTSHGFAFNVTNEPRAWFDQVVACGLHDVKAGSIESATGKEQSIEAEIPGLVERFGKLMERDMEKVNLGEENSVLGDLLRKVETDATEAGRWPRAPGHVP